MSDLLPATAISPLRQRLIDDMSLRRFSHETQRNYIRDVGRLATFLGRRPDTASAEELRRFQIEQREAGVSAPTLNAIVSALRFFFTHTLDRPDLARRLVRLAYREPRPARWSKRRSQQEKARKRPRHVDDCRHARRAAFDRRHPAIRVGGEPAQRHPERRHGPGQT